MSFKSNKSLLLSEKQQAEQDLAEIPKKNIETEEDLIRQQQLEEPTKHLDPLPLLSQWKDFKVQLVAKDEEEAVIVGADGQQPIAIKKK